MNWKPAMPTAFRHRLGTAALIACGLALSVLAAPIQAQDDEALPEAESILDKYIEVTGGAEAHQQIESRVSKGTLDVVGAGVKARVESYQAAPAKLIQVLDLEGIGQFVEGTNGEVAWEVNPLTGDRLLQGNEKHDFLRGARLDESAWREDYEKVECTGIEDVEGKPAYKVVLTPKQGNPSTNFYDKESGLLVKSVRQVESPMGQIAVEILVNDYREVDGIKIPFQSKQNILTLNQELTIEIEEVEHNVEIDEDRFAVPDSVKDKIED